MNQSVSAVRRDNEQGVVYAGRTADVILGSFDDEGWPMLEDAYANLATVPGSIKTGDESVGGGEMKCEDKATWSEFRSW